MSAQTTPLYQTHLAAGGKMVDFYGWLLPLHYGSQIAEHEAVRSRAGMFDVSHMLATDISGREAKAWLQTLLANDAAKLAAVGKALYSALLNDQGGVIDDVIAYRLNEDETAYRIVSNGATRAKNTAHFARTAAEFDVNLRARNDLAMLAVQGPEAVQLVLAVRPVWAQTVRSLQTFQGAFVSDDCFVSRTGYTGEDGLEISLPAAAAPALFQDLHEAGVQPCGLGARDTLRLEAGMNLYGKEMDDNTSPLAAGMAWTIDWRDENREFIGKIALAALKARGAAVKQVGLVLDKGGVLREGMSVITDAGEGIITSGAFSPSLKQSVALARVPAAFKGETAQVRIRDKTAAVRVVSPPFVRHGKKQFD